MNHSMSNINLSTRRLTNWQQIVLAVFFIFVAFMLVSDFAFDFNIYRNAAQNIIAGDSPYYPYAIGTSFIYHPFVLLILLPFAWLPANVGAIIWLLMSVAAYAASIYYLTGEWKRWYWVLFLFLPFVENLFVGQINTLILLSLVLCLRFSQSNQPIKAGLFLAAAIVIKLTPIILILYFLATRQWRVVAMALIGLALMTAIGITVFGVSILVDYVNIIALTAQGSHLGNFNLSMQAHLITLCEPCQPYVAWGFRLLLLAGLAVATYFAWRVKPDDRPLVFGLFVLLFVFFPPLIWMHHFVLLLIPMLILMRYPRQNLFIVVALLLIAGERALFFSILTNPATIGTPLALRLLASLAQIMLMLMTIALLVRSLRKR